MGATSMKEVAVLNNSDDAGYFDATAETMPREAFDTLFSSLLIRTSTGCLHH